MGRSSSLPLFETKSSRGRLLFKLYLASIFVAICLIWVYRISYLPEGLLQRCAWIGVFIAEAWFSFYWFLTQVVRWNPVYRFTFRDRLSQRYEKYLPGIDIFVCTADPVIEPPIMVVNTVLSVMAYDYPPEKLNVYLSDDGGSELTFYAMLEASKFSKYWLPFCKKFNVEPRSPEAYFRSAVQPLDQPDNMVKEWLFIKEIYMDMKKQIEVISKLGKVPDEIRKEHKGFREWDFVLSRGDHQTILQILLDGRHPNFVDSEGKPLPTLVYLAREKRPQYHHHFKAGAMNSLIRVSSMISDSPVILNVDCDMYSNNANAIRDALCFFMDDEKGHEIGYVQAPQAFENITKNDLYGSSLQVISEVEITGMDANGGPPYVGTGCFHRRETLCGKQYRKGYKVDWKKVGEKTTKDSSKTLKVLASCSYEENTEWGKEMGLKYGYATEDVMTGLCVQYKGWRSMCYNPERKPFLGVAPTTLLQSLVQHKRWAEGDLQIFLSRYCPFFHGRGRIPFKLQLSYSVYLLWAANSLATLFYVSVPSLCLLRGISLFPRASNPWFQPFAYAFLSNRLYGLGEFVWCGGTFQGWWNDQRIWLFKRITSYLFALADNILRLLGFTKPAFVITAKVADDDVSERYEREVMEFGSPSPMFNIIVTLALFNLFSFLGAMKMMMMTQSKVLDQFGMQIILCGLFCILNLPVYRALFFRKDKGRMSTSVTCKSLFVALLVYSIAVR